MVNESWRQSKATPNIYRSELMGMEVESQRRVRKGKHTGQSRAPRARTRQILFPRDQSNINTVNAVLMSQHFAINPYFYNNTSTRASGSGWQASCAQRWETATRLAQSRGKHNNPLKITCFRYRTWRCAQLLRNKQLIYLLSIQPHLSACQISMFRLPDDDSWYSCSCLTITQPVALLSLPSITPLYLVHYHGTISRENQYLAV